MGIDYWYACMTCKVYVDLWRNVPVRPHEKSLTRKEIDDFEQWLHLTYEKYSGAVDLSFSNDVWGWLRNHVDHEVVLVSDVHDDEPWRNYVDGWFIDKKPEWKEEMRTETSPRYANHHRRWE